MNLRVRFLCSVATAWLLRDGVRAISRNYADKPGYTQSSFGSWQQSDRAGAARAGSVTSDVGLHNFGQNSTAALGVLDDELSVEPNAELPSATNGGLTIVNVSRTAKGNDYANGKQPQHADGSAPPHAGAAAAAPANESPAATASAASAEHDAKREEPLHLDPGMLNAGSDPRVAELADAFSYVPQDADENELVVHAPSDAEPNTSLAVENLVNREEKAARRVPKTPDKPHAARASPLSTEQQGDLKARVQRLAQVIEAG